VCVIVVVYDDVFNWGYDFYYWMVFEGLYVMDFDGVVWVS